LDELRNRLCLECGVNPVALLSRTGICRRCQLRLGQRRSRTKRSSWRSKRVPGLADRRLLDHDHRDHEQRGDHHRYLEALGDPLRTFDYQAGSSTARPIRARSFVPASAGRLPSRPAASVPASRRNLNYPNATAVTVAGDHSILFDALEETAAAVAGFLNGTASTAAP
jgi:hypothetical protein